MGPFGGIPGERFDFSGNGLIDGQDTGKYQAYFNKTCRTIVSASTPTLLTSGQGNYIAWANGEASVDDAFGNEDCGSSDSVIDGTADDRESFTIPLSSVPDGAIITSVTITPWDSGDSQAGGTYQAFARVNGTDTDSFVGIATTSTSGCTVRTQTIVVPATAKSGVTLLEIGIVKTGANTNTVRVGVMRAIVNYTN